MSNNYLDSLEAQFVILHNMPKDMNKYRVTVVFGQGQAKQCADRQAVCSTNNLEIANLVYEHMLKTTCPGNLVSVVDVQTITDYNSRTIVKSETAIKSS